MLAWLDDGDQRLALVALTDAMLPSGRRVRGPLLLGNSAMLLGSRSLLWVHTGANVWATCGQSSWSRSGEDRILPEDERAPRRSSRGWEGAAMERVVLVLGYALALLLPAAELAGCWGR